MLGIQSISSKISRVERHFPPRRKPRTVLLVNPTQESSTPPLDLMKLSTFLRSRGYVPELKRGALKKISIEPWAVVLTCVFSGEIPDLRGAISQIRRLWPHAKTILSGVLPRRFGDKAHGDFGVGVLDEASEVLLDELVADYDLTPDWDASILITSKGVCPRECSHCETAARGKGVTRIIANWRIQLNSKLPRIEVWDNTLMLTPREHLVRVGQALSATEKPVDLVCGLTPNGVEEAELRWRIGQLAWVRLAPARLECNMEEELPRFHRLLAHTRSIFGDNTKYRAFAVVNGAEAPAKASERIQRMRAEGVEVDIVPYTPHYWEERGTYANRESGWTTDDLASFQ